jgi:hypothetical protein
MRFVAHVRAFPAYVQAMFPKLRLDLLVTRPVLPRRLDLFDFLSLDLHPRVPLRRVFQRRDFRLNALRSAVALTPHSPKGLGQPLGGHMAQPCRHSEAPPNPLIGRGADSGKFSEWPLRSLAILS